MRTLALLFGLVLMAPACGSNVGGGGGGDGDGSPGDNGNGNGGGDNGNGGGDNGNGNGDPNEPDGDICEEIPIEFTKLAPNVYITVDESGSMENTDCDGEQRIVCARQGLRQMVETVGEEIRLGISGFANESDPDDRVVERLPIGSHTVEDMLAAIDDIVVRGGTPMHAGVRDININNRLHDPDGDPFDDRRTKIAVLVGDGSPNSCEDEYDDIDDRSDCDIAVRRELTALLEDQGIPTFIIGFLIDRDDIFESFAEAGGTADLFDQPFFYAEEADTFAQALIDISELFIECRFVLDEPAPDPGRIWVSVNGEWLPSDAFSYDASGPAVVFSEATCDDVEAKAQDGDEVEIEIVLGCSGVIID